jgi:hypothetical protein
MADGGFDVLGCRRWTSGYWSLWWNVAADARKPEHTLRSFDVENGSDTVQKPNRHHSLPTFSCKRSGAG